jgi:uncharacterized membrane protein
MNKKGDSFVGMLIMLSITIVFFILLFLALYRVSGGAAVHEQVYSKQIALFLDNAKANTQIKTDFSKGIEIAEKYREKKLSNLEKKELIKISNNEVVVSLTSGSYSYTFFTDYEINYFFDENKLIITIT